MANFAKVEVCGNLVEDAQVLTSRAGKTYGKLRLGVTTGRDQYRQTEWWTVLVWGTNGEKVGTFLKGQEVEAKGNIRSRVWTGRDGQPHPELECHTFELPKLSEPEPPPDADEPVDGPLPDDIPF